MTLFSQHEHHALYNLNEDTYQTDSALEGIYRRLFDLQKRLYPAIKKSQLELHHNGQPLDAVQIGSVSSLATVKTLSFSFGRSIEQALRVQHVLGLGVVDTLLNPRMHPAIELRLTPDHFVVEFIIPPEARQDQENFAGKISIDDHRRHFYTLLQSYKTVYSIGFWSGSHLDDMHLNTGKMPSPQILFEYLETFSVSRDYMRVGRWYDPGELSLDHVEEELLERIKDLYAIYQFVLWSSNNNFVEFYRKGVQQR